ncbi:MAG: low temperature requirement protein A [Cellulomonadaceae bacterium]|nr:low temperature requirement protein A [Cellulomonadaceae bacterium]
MATLSGQGLSTPKPDRHSGDGRRAGAVSSAMGDDVSPVELLFDLVFVFALSQLSHHLLDHVTWIGVSETGTLLAAVFGIWSLTSFGASMPGVSRRAQVSVMFAVMTLGLFMNGGITNAFESDPWLFVGPFLTCHAGLALFYLSTATSQLMRRHAFSMIVWLAVIAALWAVGASASPELRLMWWAGAAVIDVIGAWSAHWLPGQPFRTAEVPFAPAHMIERSRLFLIIALGETILATGGAVATVPTTVATVGAAVLALLCTVALWALYFGGSDRLVTEHSSTTGDPLRAARLAINGQVVTAGGLIVLAVGLTLTIQRPLAASLPAHSMLIFGGPLLYLTAQLWYLRALTGHHSRPRLAAIGALVVACLGSVAFLTLPRMATLAISTGIMTTLGFQVVRADRHRAHPRRRLSA